MNHYHNPTKVLGILGGMGPVSHLYFEEILLKKARQLGAFCDSTYPSYVLISATDIPDRSQALSRNTSDLITSLIQYCNALNLAGADFIVVTCNTAHSLFEEVQSKINIPWINMIDEVIQHISSICETERIGIICTDGSLSHNLYANKLSTVGHIPIQPQLGSEIQDRIMNLIYNTSWGIKCNGLTLTQEAKIECKAILQWLIDQEVSYFITGCTELSVAFSRMRFSSKRWIDPLSILADSALQLAYSLDD